MNNKNIIISSYFFLFQCDKTFYIQLLFLITYPRYLFDIWQFIELFLLLFMQLLIK